VVDWKKYNKALVRRGEVILGFDVIDNWNNELEKMNDGKEGASYVYPHSFVQLLGYMRVYFHLPYRQTEGVVKAHAATNKIYHQFHIIVQLTGGCKQIGCQNH
jgi:hypothetical protein